MGNRGVSEVVAAMLLITITVSASVLFYVYSSGLLGRLTAAQPQSGQYANQITLEYYDWSTLTSLVISVRNVGSGLARIAAYYVSGTRVTPLSSSTGCPTVATLNPQASCTVTLTIPTALGGQTVLAGVAYLVKITTKDGGVFSYSCIAGKSTSSAP
jgi:flagellin-like protein